jgi:hypothetical protein
MAMIAKDGGGGEFKLIPEGVHEAICDMMVDLGMQEGGSYGPKHKVYIRFQVPSIRIEGEWGGEKYNRPAVTGVQMTLSLGRNSQMRPFLESWRGKKFEAADLRGFDITKVAGVPALINIVHEEKGDKTYANIASIMPLKGSNLKAEGEVIVHDADNDRYDDLPEWLQKKIDSAIDEQQDAFGLKPAAQQQRPQPAAFDTDLDDDVPF